MSRKDWGLEEWRKVIFSDEASIIVSAKRGQQIISRVVGEEERYHPDCIERRYNNYSEAMFWACFTCDYKGPCHIYYPETPKQKAKNEGEIVRLKTKRSRQSAMPLSTHKSERKRRSGTRRDRNGHLNGPRGRYIERITNIRRVPQEGGKTTFGI